MRVLVLLTDAYGSSGGMAQYNRDFLQALCTYPDIAEVVAVPRFQRAAAGPLPGKLNYSTEGLNSKLKYVNWVWKLLRSEPAISLVIIAHLNLLPLVKLLKSQPVAHTSLLLFGSEAWASRNWLYRSSLSRVDACISISETTKERFCSWSGFHAGRVAILPVSVDLNRFVPGPKNPELVKRYRLEGKTVLMTLGRLEAMEQAKGFDQVMQALPDLLKEVPNLTYLICGEGSDRPRLEQKARQLKLETQVVFAGHVAEEAKVDHYRLADAYVMPSRREGFGIVFLEAMACGVPVVASKIDGSREAVRDPGWGVLVNPDSQGDIKAGVVEALKRPRGARPRGLEYYSVANFEQRTHELLRAMVEARSPSEH